MHKTNKSFTDFVSQSRITRGKYDRRTVTSLRQNLPPKKSLLRDMPTSRKKSYNSAGVCGGQRKTSATRAPEIEIRPQTPASTHFSQTPSQLRRLVYMCCALPHTSNDRDRMSCWKETCFFSHQAPPMKSCPAGRDDIAVNFIILPESSSTAALHDGAGKCAAGSFFLHPVEPWTHRSLYPCTFRQRDPAVQNLIETCSGT